MRRSITVLLCLMAAALSIVGFSGPAAAVGAADKSRVVTTEDGWQLRITKAAETLDRVPNLAASPFTREGYVSLQAIADITGPGRAAVNSGSVTLGYQVGCQVDVSNGLTVGLSLAAGPNVGIVVAPIPGLSVGGSALAIPSVSFSPKPGAITTIPFGTKTLSGSYGSITADQVQIKVDSCLGPVSIRSYAVVSVSSARADNSVAVYGDPLWL